ncbi:MAG: exosortase-associated EpsI family protein [Fuerstiella sp.]
MPTKLTRLRAALLGCGLALTSCLITAASHPTMPQKCAFELPQMLGAWKLVQQGSPDESELKILQATDHWQRVYQCQETNRIVVVTLIAGAAGPLVSHQPEVCYARNEFSSHSDARIWTVPERRDMFRMQTLEPRQITQPALTVVYAWHDGDRWRAPRFPRLQLAGNATLQRLQITMRHPGGGAGDAEATMQQMVQLILNATDGPVPQVASQPTPPTVSL